MERLGELGYVEADGIGAGGERRGGTFVGARLAGRGSQRDDRHGLAGRAARARVEAVDAGGNQEVGAHTLDALGDPGLDARSPSPSAARGLSGPNRTKRLPAASLPDAAQRTTWPQNR